MFILQINPNPDPPNPNPDPPNPNPIDQPDDFNPNQNNDHGVGGGRAAALNNIRIHQADWFDAVADTVQLNGEAGMIERGTASLVIGAAANAGATKIPVIGGLFLGFDVYADIRRANNTPYTSDLIEVRLRRYIEQGLLTQEQVNRIRTMANSADFNRDTFRDLILGMGIPPGGENGANQFADVARDNRRRIQVNNHNATANTTATCIGAGVGVGAVIAGMALFGAANCWNPVGWTVGGVLAVVAVVTVCASVGNFIGSFFRW